MQVVAVRVVVLSVVMVYVEEGLMERQEQALEIRLLGALVV